MYKLIVFNDGREPIVVSDEEIKEGDWALDETFKAVNLWFYPEKLKGKIIAQGFSQIDFNGLESEFDVINVEKVANNFANDFNTSKMNIEWQAAYVGYQKGFKAAQQLNTKKFSEEDMQKSYYKGAADCHDKCTIRNWKGVEQKVDVDNLKVLGNTHIQSLSKPYQIYDVEIEMGYMKLNEDGQSYGFPDMSLPKVVGGKIKILKTK